MHQMIYTVLLENINQAFVIAVTRSKFAKIIFYLTYRKKTADIGNEIFTMFDYN